MDAAELLWERDEARAKLAPLQKENIRLKELLFYANDAIRGEYERAEHWRRVAETSTRSDK